MENYVKSNKEKYFTEAYRKIRYFIVPINFSQSDIDHCEKTINDIHKEFAETTDFNTTEKNGSKIGIITDGIAYMYAKEALGDRVSYLKLGMVYPMPEKLGVLTRNAGSLKIRLKRSNLAWAALEIESLITSH